jgi:hypothetical protein
MLLHGTTVGTLSVAQVSRVGHIMSGARLVPEPNLNRRCWRNILLGQRLPHCLSDVLLKSSIVAGDCSGVLAVR